MRICHFEPSRSWVRNLSSSSPLTSVPEFRYSPDCFFKVLSVSIPPTTSVFTFLLARRTPNLRGLVDHSRRPYALRKNVRPCVLFSALGVSRLLPAAGPAFHLFQPSSPRSFAEFPRRPHRRATHQRRHARRHRSPHRRLRR